MLDWEAVLGTCEAPSGVSSDFIDALTAPDAGLSFEHAMLALKARLVSNPTWEPDVGTIGEQDLAESLLMGAAMSDPASDDPQAIRRFCGALLRSPQFLLAGLPPWPSDADPTPLPHTPCVDTYCTEQEYCAYFEATSQLLGYPEAIVCW